MDRVLRQVAVTIAAAAMLGIASLAAPAPAPAQDRSVAAAQTPKQQCINACRARYHDCRRQNQVPAFECQNVYQDCVRYSCTGLGPG